MAGDRHAGRRAAQKARPTPIVHNWLAKFLNKNEGACVGGGLRINFSSTTLTLTPTL